MSESEVARATESALRFPAEVLYMIAGYCFPTWSDHDLWFRLGHSTHVLRNAVTDHVQKRLQDKDSTFHTRLEKYCKGNIIRDAASANRIETYLRQPAAVYSGALTRRKLSHDSPLRDEDDTGHGAGVALTDDMARRWELHSIGGKEVHESYTAVFTTTCDVGDTDQDLIRCIPAMSYSRQLHMMTSTSERNEQSDPKQPLAPNADNVSEQPKEAMFFCKALSRETAETGKIDFDDICLAAKWVEAAADKAGRAVRGKVFFVGIDWREIWSKKLGRERYCQQRYAEKQREVQTRRREQMKKMPGAAVVAT